MPTRNIFGLNRKKLDEIRAARLAEPKDDSPPPPPGQGEADELERRHNRRKQISQATLDRRMTR